jgi:hypothetical protein
MKRFVNVAGAELAQINGGWLSVSALSLLEKSVSILRAIMR